VVNCSSVVRIGDGSSYGVVLERDGELEPRREAVRSEFLRHRLGYGESESGATPARENPADFRHLSGLYAAGLSDRRLRCRLPYKVRQWSPKPLGPPANFCYSFALY
jgi:hypothetical protein